MLLRFSLYCISRSYFRTVFHNFPAISSFNERPRENESNERENQGESNHARVSYRDWFLFKIHVLRSLKLPSLLHIFPPFSSYFAFFFLLFICFSHWILFSFIFPVFHFIFLFLQFQLSIFFFVLLLFPPLSFFSHFIIFFFWNLGESSLSVSSSCNKIVALFIIFRKSPSYFLPSQSVEIFFSHFLFILLVVVDETISPAQIPRAINLTVSYKYRQRACFILTRSWLIQITDTWRLSSSYCQFNVHNVNQINFGSLIRRLIRQNHDQWFFY